MLGPTYELLKPVWNNVSTIGLLSQAFFSLLLVLLYRNQYKTLEEQKDIAEMEYQGIIRVDDSDAEKNEVFVTLSNFGKGVIEELHLITEFHPDGDIENLSESPEEALRIHSDGDDSTSRTLHSPVIGGRESRKKFRAVPKVKYNNKVKHADSALAQILSNDDVDYVDIIFWVEGIDQSGRNVRDKLYYHSLRVEEAEMAEGIISSINLGDKYQSDSRYGDKLVSKQQD